jgi:RNA polymerase sigma-70 factor, ECF subfamily
MSCTASDILRRIRTDEELMLAVRAGDLAAFEHLVVRHQSSAWNAAYRFLGDAAEAEDLAQEAFLKILDAAPRYQPTAKFRTYLYRVVTRLCLDSVQKKKPFYTENVPNLPDDGLSPLDVLSTEEMGRRIREALDQLPPKQRMTIILRYYEGLGYAEIASAMETTAKAVERLLARARSALEIILGKLIEN